MVVRMNKALVTILFFAGLLLFIISPFTALPTFLVLYLLVAAFLWVLSTVVQAVTGAGDTKSDSP